MAVWRHRRFRLFWIGDTISAAGGALSTVAVPLLAVGSLHASDAEVGVVKAAQTLPFLLLAIPIGLLADRVSRRRLLLSADAVRFPLVAVIALAGGALGVPALIGLVFVVGVGTVAYEVAYLSVLPELVEGPGELPAANRAVETAHAGASLVGPAAGGVLVAALGAAGVVALDAVSFAVGAGLTAINRWERPRSGRRLWTAGGKCRTGVVDSAPPVTGWGRPGGPTPAQNKSTLDHEEQQPAADEPTAPTRGTAALLAGWTWLWGDGFVRPMTLYLAANNLAAQAFQTALLLFVVGAQHRSPTAFGLALAASGAGFLAGAAISPAAARRLGTGRVIIGASLVGAAGIAVVASGGFPAVLIGSLLAGTGPGMLNLHFIAVRQAIAPRPLLGRVNAVVKTISYGSSTLGALLGGVAAGASSPRTVIVAAAIVSAAATAFPAFSAVRNR